MQIVKEKSDELELLTLQMANLTLSNVYEDYNIKLIYKTHDTLESIQFYSI